MASETTCQKATCRWCRRELIGKPYSQGGPAYHPVTKERCPVNHYGGFVCSPNCDYQASLDLEQSMPGHGVRQKQIGSYAMDRYKQNWKGVANAP